MERKKENGMATKVDVTTTTQMVEITIRKEFINLKQVANQGGHRGVKTNRGI